MGASFPLVTKIYTGSANQLGRSIGNVYAINTVGSILGSFCAGFVFIPLLGIRPSIVFMVALNTGIGCLLIFFSADAVSQRATGKAFPTRCRYRDADSERRLSGYLVAHR